MFDSQTPGTYIAARRRLACLFACLTMLLVPAASADDLCGATIVANFKLDHDLVCAGDGLIVGADGIEVNLGGFTITGSGAGNGISLTGRTNVWVTGGRVRSFAAGVRTLNSTGIVVRGNEFVENGDGIDLQAGSIANSIKENEFRNNTLRGIMIRSASTRHVIKDNTFTGNRVGILVFGGVENVLAGNIVSGSLAAAIRLNVIATGNLIISNTVMSSPAGFDFVITPTGAAAGNTFVQNTIAMNDCGLKGPAGGNRFSRNLFEGNAVDSCP